MFDVDDCGLGVPALDLAVATFYLRSGEAGDEAVEARLRAGYDGIRPLPEIDPAHFEALIAARQLLLANSLLASATSGQRVEGVDYLAVTVDRLLRWRSTGRFSRGVGAGT